MKFMNKLIATIMLLTASAVVNADRLAPGYFHTLMIDDNQDVIAMGISRNGEIGPNAPAQSETYYGMAPIHVGIKAKDVAANISRSAAVKLDGSVVTWGRGVANVVSFEPIEVGSFTNAVKVSIELYALYILDETGSVFEMDYNSGNIRKLSLTNISDLKSGLYHTLFLASNGDVYARGSNSQGELCLGDNVSRSDPAKTEIINATSIAAGTAHTVVALADGTAVACGNNTYGKLGNASEISSSTPVAVQYLTGIVKVTATDAASFALMEDGSVYGWGWHNYIGNGSYNVDRTRAVQIIELSQVEEFAASSQHIMFRDIFGNVTGMIGNLYGMLGDGTNTERHNPVAVLPATPLEVALVDPVIDSVAPGGSYIILGSDFGDVEGLVFVDGVQLVIKSWTNNEVHVENPLDQITGYLTVTTADGLISNPVYVTLEPDAPSEVIIEPVIIEEPVVETDCKRGYGYGDKNHCHSGPTKSNDKGNGKK